MLVFEAFLEEVIDGIWESIVLFLCKMNRKIYISFNYLFLA